MSFRPFPCIRCWHLLSNLQDDWGEGEKREEKVCSWGVGRGRAEVAQRDLLFRRMFCFSRPVVRGGDDGWVVLRGVVVMVVVVVSLSTERITDFRSYGLWVCSTEEGGWDSCTFGCFFPPSFLVFFSS